MINAHRTGAYISSLRKAKDWTQLQLAEKLHVTHQAVSQWEKGASFPDVSLLPALARLFGISVDDLLNGEPSAHTGHVTPGAIIEELARGNPGEAARLVKNDSEGVNAMLESAPLAQPSQLNAVVANLADYHFTLKQLAGLAPFVSQDILESLLNSANIEQIDGDLLVELAPFVPQATLGRLTGHITPDTLRLEHVAELASFLEKPALKALLYRVLETGAQLEPEHLANMAPFLEQETLNELLQRLPPDALALEHVVEMAPFVSRDTLEGLLGRLSDPGTLGDYLEELAPFLGKAGLKRAISGLKRSLRPEELVELAPFLDKDMLDEILRKGMR